MITITLKSRPVVLDEAAQFDLPNCRIRLEQKKYYDYVDITLVPTSMKLEDAGSILVVPIAEFPKIWKVWSVKAPHGFGPALYEIEMEIAQLKGAIGLTPDTSIVSSEAQKVWQHYLSRPDIETLPLPDDFKFATPRPDEIKKIFRKRAPNYIQKLLDADKIDDPQGVLKL